MNKNADICDVRAMVLNVVDQRELRACPWCKKVPKIQLTDAEGNFRNESYLDDPYSGVGYALIHTTNDLDDKCPIATVDEYILGEMTYDTKEEAIAAWNAWEDTE